jgi:hypothetical protein
MGGKSSAPPAPDYKGAAQEQAASSKEATTQQNWANRPDQYTAWGSSTWNPTSATDPSTGQQVTRWTQQEQLNPQLQSALNEQLGMQSAQNQLASSFMGRVQQDFNKPFDWSNLPGMSGTPQAQMTGTYGTQSYIPQTGQQTDLQRYNYDTSAPQQTTQTTNEPAFAQERQRIEEGLFSRMRPEQQRQEDTTRNMLANQGLAPGTEAYNRELQRLHEQQAGERFNALQTGGQEQQRMHGMLLGQQAQAFGQDVQSQQAQNAALEAQFGQGLQAGQFTNQALQNQYQQGLTQGQFYNQAGQQAFGQEQAANAQNFQQANMQAEFQNRLRQQAIAEQSMQRNMSLNEMNAMKTGQQVTNPQFANFSTAQGAQPLQALAAAQGQGQYGMDAAKLDAQGQSGLWQGLGSAAGAAAMVF